METSFWYLEYFWLLDDFPWESRVSLKQHPIFTPPNFLTHFFTSDASAPFKSDTYCFNAFGLHSTFNLTWRAYYHLLSTLHAFLYTRHFITFNLLTLDISLHSTSTDNGGFQSSWPTLWRQSSAVFRQSEFVRLRHLLDCHQDTTGYHWQPKMSAPHFHLNRM